MDRLLACTCSLLASPSSLPHLLPRKIVSKRDRVINLRNSRYHFSSIGERKLRYDETRVIKLLTMLSFTLVETRLVTIVLISKSTFDIYTISSPIHDNYLHKNSGKIIEKMQDTFVSLAAIRNLSFFYSSIN